MLLLLLLLLLLVLLLLLLMLPLFILLMLLLLLVSWVLQSRSDRRENARAEREQLRAQGEFDAMAGGYPVPPMPGQQPIFASRRDNAGITIVQERSDVTQEAIDG